MSPAEHQPDGAECDVNRRDHDGDGARPRPPLEVAEVVQDRQRRKDDRGRHPVDRQGVAPCQVTEVLVADVEQRPTKAVSDGEGADDGDRVDADREQRPVDVRQGRQAECGDEPE